MAIEYLGHKQQLLPFLMPLFDSIGGGRPTKAVDLFCGTGSVSGALREAGWAVHANDTLSLCVVMTSALLLNPAAPDFAGIPDARGDGHGTRYAQVLASLQALPPEEGYCWRTFSPASARFEDVTRQYFTAENAARVDAIRAQIQRWRPWLTAGEHALLLRSLVEAVNAVSNIAGTYGCYMKHWKRRAKKPLTLSPLSLSAGGLPAARHAVSQEDAAAAAAVEATVAYADPPYTKRQYAAYYHVLETIIRDDRPVPAGSTGLRDWAQDASDWCYKRRAPAALEQLLGALASPHLLLSYNEDGQIPHERILDILRRHGRVTVHEHTHRRYKSSDLDHKGNQLIERVYHLERT